MNFLFILLAASGLGSGVYGQISKAVPPHPSATSFTCRGKAPGYYADLETGCKTYHVCDGVTHFTYVCPRRTLFQESSRICDHSHLVRCGEGAGSDSRDDEEEILIRPTETSEKPARREENKGDGTDRVGISTPKETSPHTETTDIPTTPAPSGIRKPTTQKPPSEPTIKNFLKFSLKDLRALFFIPELSNNSVAVEPERELVVPLEKGDLVRFRIKKKASVSFSACPAYCNPKFFLPGTCHPCIMIK